MCKKYSLLFPFEYEKGINVYTEALSTYNNKLPIKPNERQLITDHLQKIMKNKDLAESRTKEIKKKQKLRKKTPSGNSITEKISSITDNLRISGRSSRGEKEAKSKDSEYVPPMPQPRRYQREISYTGFSRDYTKNRLMSDDEDTYSPTPPAAISKRPAPPRPQSRPAWNSNYKSPYSQSASKSSSPKRTTNRSPTGAKKNSGDIPKLDMKGLDEKMVKSILDELTVLPKNNKLKLTEVAGNEQAKRALNETVILPACNPKIFTGLRAPPKGILLFGPPGCGKTLLAKALASESKQTFFNISASSLTSKWVGESEKLVKTLFNLARQLQPTIIFMDEIDSILTARKENENDSSRRLKTEFMLQFDGMVSSSDEKLLILAATNRPQELDDAVLRRFPKRIYIQLPNPTARGDLLQRLLIDQPSKISPSEMNDLISRTNNYSGSDLAQLAKEAAYEPIRNMNAEQISKLNDANVPPIKYKHFISALSRIRPSVGLDSLNVYVDWTKKFGDIS